MRHAAPTLLALLSLLTPALALREGAPPPREGAPPPRVTSDRLGGPDRFLTHVTTDKPIYQAGETVYARGVVLHATNRRPGDTPWCRVEVVGPKGDVVFQSQGSGSDGVVPFAWVVPAGQPGGRYKLRMMPSQAAPGERAFEVRAFRAPRIRTQIAFLRDGYGPGDEVSATLSATRAEGGAPAGSRVTLVAMVDGAEVAHEPAGVVDDEGRARVSFRLPKDIERGEGTLALVIEDGGVVETASKTIPILVRAVDLTAYPEGGDLVAGIPTRVYFEARLPSGKPADVAGDVVTSQGRVIATFRTEHEGRGRVRISPLAGEQYQLRVTEPAGVTTSCALPPVQDAGGSVSAVEDVAPPLVPLRLRLAASHSGEYEVTVASRETDVATRRVELRRGELKPLAVELDDEVEGVLRVTLWSGGFPLAERLVFRRPSRRVHVALSLDRPRYVPAGTVELRVKTTDGDGAPLPATVGLSVSDDSVRELLETRDQPPQLPVQVFVENDVRELADAAVYMSPDDPKAPRAMDLLLGTQGWRRFAFVGDVQAFVNAHGDAARRVLAGCGGGDISMGCGSGAQVAYRIDHLAANNSVDGGLRAQLPALAVKSFKLITTGASARFGERSTGVEAIVAPPRGRREPAEMEADDQGVEGGVMGGVIGGVIPGPPVLAAEMMVEIAAPQGELVDAMMAPAEPAVEGELMQRIPLMNRRMNDIVALMPGVAPAGKDKEDVGKREQGRVVGEARRMLADPSPAPAAVVRVYAHANRAGRVPGDRIDFTDTVYWNAGLRTDADGEARVSFTLSDSVTSFRVLCDAFTPDGVLGAGTQLLESVEPFYVEPKMPLELTSGDVVRLPVTAVNGSLDRLPDVALSATAGSPLFAGTLAPITLEPGDRVRRILDVRAGATPGTAELTITGTAGAHHDAVTRSVRVVPLGFPASQSFGGTLAPGARASHPVAIPDDVVGGSVRADIRLFPTSLGKLTSALERLIQEPHGCFEQTSSTTYPLVMAAQYFQSHQGVDPSLVTRSQEMLAKGYAKLTAFETTTKGYEWFGQAPGHEALSAFGLLEFTDMSRVRQVDPAMLARTREWILSTRDGKGGFRRERRALHTWIEDVDCSNAYITWALLQAGEDPKAIASEIDAVSRAARASSNSYVHALAANVLQAAGRGADAGALLGQLAQRQEAGGAVGGATASIVGSSGEALQIETTSLAALAWLRSPAHEAQLEKSIRWLAESCQGGRYGSTQSTVLALRAIVEHDAARSRPRAAGSVALLVDGKPVGSAIAFDEKTDGALVFPDAGALLTAGTHRVELAMTDGSAMPYAIEIALSREKPESSPECPLDLRVEMTSDRLDEGAIGEAAMTLGSRRDEPLPMVVAIVGLPGGVEPRHEQLKELVGAKRIAAYEVIGREVVLYFRSLPPRAELRIPVSFVAAVPGTYTGAASRAYLYYGDEHKIWAPGLKAEIAAR